MLGGFSILKYHYNGKGVTMNISDTKTPNYNEIKKK